MNNHIDYKLVLIAVPPGNLQIGLQAIISSLLDVDVLAVSELESITKIINRYEPSLILLDEKLTREKSPATIIELKDLYPEIPMMVLVDDDHPIKTLKEIGVDRVIVKGLQGHDLAQEIFNLLYE